MNSVAANGHLLLSGVVKEHHESVIKTSNEMKTLWGETFLRDEILNFWTGVSTKFNPRCWHPDLFYNTKPNQINYYSSDSDDDENSLLARYDGHNYNDQ